MTANSNYVLNFTKYFGGMSDYDEISSGIQAVVTTIHSKLFYLVLVALYSDFIEIVLVINISWISLFYLYINRYCKDIKPNFIL